MTSTDKKNISTISKSPDTSSSAVAVAPSSAAPGLPFAAPWNAPARRSCEAARPAGWRPVRNFMTSILSKQPHAN